MNGGAAPSDEVARRRDRILRRRARLEVLVSRLTAGEPAPTPAAIHAGPTGRPSERPAQPPIASPPVYSASADSTFPRSHTMRLLLRHPGASAAFGLTVAALLASRGHGIRLLQLAATPARLEALVFALKCLEQLDAAHHKRRNR